MPTLLTTGQLTVIIDKLARFASESVGDPEFNNSFNAGMALASTDVLSGAGGIATYLLTLNVEDVEADLLPAARNLDENNPVPPDGFLITVPGIKAMLAAIDTHYKTVGGFAGLDAYLTSLNGATGMTPTLRAHGHFKKYLKTLSRQNAFVPVDTVLATFTELTATTGTYAHLAAVPTTYAGAQLKIKNVTALTTSAVVSVTAKKIDGTTAVLTATLSTHTINAETALSDTAKIYTDVTGISITTGTAADEFEVVAKTDRSVASA